MKNLKPAKNVDSLDATYKDDVRIGKGALGGENFFDGCATAGNRSSDFAVLLRKFGAGDGARTRTPAFKPNIFYLIDEDEGHTCRDQALLNLLRRLKRR